MPSILIATPFNIDIEFDAAPIHKRLFAYLIDFSLLFIYLISMLYFLLGTMELTDNSSGFITLIILLPMLLYTLVSELWMNGQTIGKKIFRIKVISLDGHEPTFGQYLLRWFLRFYEWGFVVFAFFWGGFSFGFIIWLSGGILSIFIIALNKNNQRLGDIVAQTTVVNIRSHFTVDDTIFLNIANKDYKVKFPEVMRLSDRDINTVMNVVRQSRKTDNFELSNRVAEKVKDVLKISTDMYNIDFLEKILEDYNYLATKE